MLQNLCGARGGHASAGFVVRNCRAGWQSAGCIMGGLSQTGNRSGLRTAAAGVGLVLLAAAAIHFRFILLAAVIGVIGGVLFAPLVCWLQKRARLPHGLSVLLAALLVLGAIGGLGYGVGSLFAQQIHRLFEQGPGIVESIRNTVEPLVSRFVNVSEVNEQVEWGTVAQQTLKGLLFGAKTGLEVAAAVIVVLAIAIFVGANSDDYLRGLLTLFKPARRAEVERLAHGSAAVVRRWFWSQLIVVLISGALSALIFGMMGIDFWLLIAVLTIVLDFVPLLGALLTGAIAVLLSLGTDPDKVWWVLLAFILIQQVETDVTLPLVMKQRIRLPEAQLIIFTLMMGAGFGVAGVFAAPPMFAVLHFLYHEAYVPRIEGRSVSTEPIPDRTPCGSDD